MSTNITPEEAKSIDDKLLTEWANLYRPSSGAYLVVTNEIARRDDVKKLKRKMVGIAVSALIAGIIGFVFFLLRS